MVTLRLHRIFGTDGRTVIVAMDHASYFGPIPGIDSPGRTLRAVVEAGADAVLTTAGIAARFGDCLGRAGLILRVDGGSTNRAPQPGPLRQIVSIERALRLGADALVCMGMIGHEEETSSLHVLTSLVDQCSSLGMPVMAEMLVKREAGAHPSAEDIAFAARIGAELGASLIKTPYVPPAEEYRVVTETCYVPVVVLGGARADNERSVLTRVDDALRAGAAGVAMGRNVWQHTDPGGMTRALVALVHGRATVDEAFKEIQT